MAFKKSGRQKLGQHFLADSGIIEKIIQAGEIDKSTNILEIGPGQGALTQRLYRAGKSLTLIEADRGLSAELERSFPDAEVICDNAERVDFKELPENLVIISNLPYYASVHIFKHCTKFKGRVERMVLMFQLEVAKRISAGPGSRNYGSLSLLSGFHWKIEQVLDVPPKAFNPPPKVHSSVLRFTPRQTPPVKSDEKELFKLIKLAFTQKRRTLKNNLKGIYPAELLDESFAFAGLGEKARAEEVSLEVFAKLLEKLDKAKI